MESEIIKSNSNDDRKHAILQAAGMQELYPIQVDQRISAVDHTRISLSQLTSFGTAFEPLKQAVQSVINGPGGSGLYKVTVPKGGHLAVFNDGSGYLGGALKFNNQVGAGQARLNPIICDPTMIFMAATLANIDRKLDKIMEMQRDLMDYLVQKDRAEQIGDLNFLTDTYNNYKYNWNNEKYINSYLIKVQDIKQAAEQKIEFFKTRITSKINKKSFFHLDHNVKSQMEDVRSSFKDYQLAIYLYAFASFIEVMFLENFDPQYLTNITIKINEFSKKYTELYEECYEEIDKYSQSSLQSVARKLSAAAGKGIGAGLESFAGKVKDNATEHMALPESNDVPLEAPKPLQEGLQKIAIFGKGISRGINKGIRDAADKVQNDRSFSALGEKISQRHDDISEQLMETFREDQSVYVRPFVDNIDTINHLYNEDLEMLFDRDYIYIGTASAS